MLGQSKNFVQRFRNQIRKLRFKPLFRLDLLLTIIALTFFASRYSNIQAPVENLAPKQIYSLSFSTRFEPDTTETNIYTYLPLNNARQTRLQEQISDELPWSIKTDMSGRTLHWSGDEHTQSVRYEVKVATKAVKYKIDESLVIPNQYDTSLQTYLNETETVQFNHPEIVELWQNIKPSNNHQTLSVLKTIYDYTYKNLESANFKGTTDALTALRLGVASCNGKSRLFVALARLNNLPARLVGGVILEEGAKRTSHQWVEVYIENHWIPFGPTNGYFSEIPAHYLRLYQGDEALIRHTSNINFDFQFEVKKLQVAPVFYDDLLKGKENTINLSSILKTLNLSSVAVGVLLMFPLCTLLITFLRNVIGLKTYGIFMPMLIAAACLFTGLIKGIIGFSLILAFAWAVHAILEKMRLLKTARLAIVITAVTMLLMAGIYFLESHLRVEFSILSIFPVVIISFVAEKIHQDSNQNQTRELLLNIAGTFVTIVCCFLAMNSVLLQGIFSLYPECYLLVLAALIYIGGWSGLRINELLRFKNIISVHSPSVLGINRRNREVIYKHNDKKLLKLAADKLLTKKALAELDIPHPATIAIFANISDTRSARKTLINHNSFVVKPNCGSQGKGIVVISHKQADDFISAGGKHWSMSKIEDHIKETISGSFSQDGDTDFAYIEPLIIQHPNLQKISKNGLCDIRVIVAKGKAVSAMLRIPTNSSAGKANLHQGAIGVAIDINTGLSTRAQINGRIIKCHPDNGEDLIDLSIPCWQSIVAIAEKCFQAVPLGYLGVDICIDRDKGPLVLEINGRPGLEIQNVQNYGFEEKLIGTLEASV